MKTIFSVIFLFIFYVSHAQVASSKLGVILGVLIDDSTRLPIEFGAIKIYRSKDSVLVAGIYSDEKGSFYLDQLPFGSFTVKITASGYTPRRSNNVELSASKERRDFGDISLTAINNEIGTVTVNGEREAFKVNLDKKTYDVAKDPSVRGGTLSDILLNIPSISIDQEGKITLRGEGNVVVLVNGKPSVFGSNGSAALANIPASSIERVELISNPSASFDPNGSTGFINIILKKNSLKGVNGQITATAATGNLYNTSFSLNARNKKFNAFANYSLRHYEGFRNNKGILEVKTPVITTLDQDRIGTDFNVNHVARAGFDFYATPVSTFGLSLTYTNGNRFRWGDLNNILYDANANVLKSWNRISLDPVQNNGLELNLNYKYEISKERGEILVDFNTLKAVENTQGIYTEKYRTASGYTLPGIKNWQDLDNKEQNLQGQASVDYKRRFNDKKRLETGVKTTWRFLEQNTLSRTLDTNGLVVNNLGNTYVYKFSENTASAYGLFKNSYKLWTYQVGIRAEFAQWIPALITTNEKFRKEYLQLFPSLALSYEVKKGFELIFNYGRRLNRPVSGDLNPFTVLSDPYNLRRGNPNLKPEFSHSFEVSTILVKPKFTFNVGLYARFTDNLIARVKYFDPDGTSAVSYANISKSQVIGTDIVFNYFLTKWMKVNTSLTGNIVDYRDNSNSLYQWSRKGATYGGKLGIVFELWKKTTTITINGRYNAPVITAQGIAQQRPALDVAFDRSFQGGKWLVSMRVGDVLKTQGFEFSINQPLAEQQAEFTQLTRRFFMTVTYKFGKMEALDPKKMAKPAGDGGGGDF
jgi:outer membrane cobalamin receptor